MDFTRPVQAVIPGAQGKILGVLAEVSTGLSLRAIARLSGVSPAQTSRIMSTLVELGMVKRRDVPPTALFELVREHVAARAVVALARSRSTAVCELARSAAEMTPPPVSVVVFGSVARGEAEPRSDLDVLFVRSEAVGPDQEDWGAAVEHWRGSAERLTGNHVEILEVAEDEVRSLLRGDRPLWRDIAREGITIAGRSIQEMAAASDA